MRVLLVEDDPGIGQGLAATLRSEGYAVDVCATLGHATASLEVEHFDLVLLDLTLPDGDGLEWLRALRSRTSAQSPATLPGVPVLIMTARDALPDKVAGLDHGADDYLVKPFEPDEMLARMRVALRRSAGRADPLLHHGDLVVDPASHAVSLAGRPVPLRAKEFALLLVMLRARGRVLSRSRLEEALYGFGETLESNALEVHVHHLRRKLGDDLIQTVRGVGYFIPRPTAGKGTEP